MSACHRSPFYHVINNANEMIHPAGDEFVQK